MGAGRLSHNEPAAVHLRCKLLDFVEHEPSDTLASQIARHNDIVDLNCVRREMNFNDRNEVTDELAEEAGCRISILPPQEAADSHFVSRFDGSDEEFLPFQADLFRGDILARLPATALSQIIS